MPLATGGGPPCSLGLRAKDKIFLETAKKLADYFIEFLPEDYVPY